MRRVGEAAVVEGLRSGSEGFVFINKTTPGGNSPNVITVTVGPNETTDSRSCAIRLTSEGGVGTAAMQDVSFTQDAGQGLSAEVMGIERFAASVPSAGGSFTIDVTPGGSATGWAAAITSFRNFAAIDKTAPGRT